MREKKLSFCINDHLHLAKTYSECKKLILSDLLAKSMSQRFDLCLSVLLALGEIFNGFLVFCYQLLIALVVFLVLCLFFFILHPALAVFEGKIDCNERQVVKEFVSLLMSNEIFYLRVDNSPKRSFLHRTLRVLAVQESNVKHLSSFVTTCIK